MSTKPRGIVTTVTYYLSEHPSMRTFRWTHSHSFLSTWTFLLYSLTLYHLASVLLRLALLSLRRRRPVPLGPLPALHSLLTSLLCISIFLGTLLSSSAEIRDSRWRWLGRSPSSPLQWLLCFPLGTRSSGPVFFWSYAFYLSRLLHLSRTFLTVLSHPSSSSLDLTLHLFARSASLVSAFLWLEFSQSFQVVAVASTALADAVVYGYRFWVEVGLPVGGFPFVWGCRVVMVLWLVVGHVGVGLLVWVGKRGCSGLGAWVFNSVVNGLLLLVFVGCCLKEKGWRGLWVGRSGAVEALKVKKEQ